MNIIIKGKITDIKDTEVIGKFEKRNLFVEEEEGQYPNTFNLEAQQGFCATLDNYSIGDKVECQVDVKGRAWSKNGKSGVINCLKIWKLTRQPGTVIPTPTYPAQDDSQLPF